MSYLSGGTLLGPLRFTSRTSPGLSPAGQGRIYFDQATNKFVVSENGGAYVDLVAGTESLAATLAVGNTTGGNDIVVSTGQKITSQTDLEVKAVAGAAPGNLILWGGDASGVGPTNGGSIEITSGGAVGGGTGGNITIGTYSTGGVEIAGDISIGTDTGGSVGITSSEAMQINSSGLMEIESDQEILIRYSTFQQRAAIQMSDAGMTIETTNQGAGTRPLTIQSEESITLSAPTLNLNGSTTMLDMTPVAARPEWFTESKRGFWVSSADGRAYYWDGTADTAWGGGGGGGGLQPWREFPSVCGRIPATTYDAAVAWGRAGGGHLASGANVSALAHGVEADGANIASYVEYAYNYDDGDVQLDWHVQIPDGFTGWGWGTSAIRLRHRHPSIGVGGEYRLTLTVFHPTTGAPLTAQTHDATSAESSYSWLTIAASALGSTFSAGQLLHLRVSVGYVVQGSSGANQVRFGALELNWE